MSVDVADTATSIDPIEKHPSAILILTDTGRNRRLDARPDPSWTVIEIATGREHGPYDSEADVALCLVFEKLARDEVEVVADVSPMATMTAPP